MVNKITSPITPLEEVDKINEIIDNKQDTLVSGTNIKTINNQSIVGSGNIDVGGGSVDVDNKSITTNSSDEIQTVGVINSRDTSTAIKTWTGTRSQYDAIQSKDANTLYNIADDTDVSLTILEALYPVGSIYITTASTCPLSILISGSTWSLVSSGRVLQGADSDHAVGTTIEAGLPNITGSVTAARGINSIYEGCIQSRNEAKSNEYQGQYGSLYNGFSFDASRSSSIYGNSTTVQPPAYVVNIYRRTA